ncbi:MAG: hypothetical protein K2X87_31635 [Gemmataceae bacterium]|nr:hypothetical protein [Gemmataceae bacterium]
MAAPTAGLTDAVGVHDGKPCPNRPADVRLVKERLNAHAGRFGLARPLDVTNPHCGDTTRKAIEDFQRPVRRKEPPYGRVLPLARGGTTLKALLAAPAGAAGEWGATRPGGPRTRSSGA